VVGDAEGGVVEGGEEEAEDAAGGVEGGEGGEG